MATNRQVFLSFLGTSDYVEVHYNMTDYESKLVRFIQESAVELFLRDKAKELPYKIYIFCTKESEAKNWWDDGHKDKNDQPLKREGLSTRLHSLFQKEGLDESNIEMIVIPEGFTEEEIWQLFNQVYDVLEEGDEVTFDMTHSFRSIPLFSTVLFNYARVMKHVEVKKIYYGAFEKLGPSFKVKEKPEDERIAPIIDMTSIVNLQKTTIAASDFIKFGKMGSLAEVLKAIDKDIETNRFKEFDFLINTNRIDYIKEGKWKQKFDDVVTSKPLKKYNILPIKELLQKINDEVKGFVAEKDNRNVEAAIDWARNHDMIAQALTMAREYVLSIVCDIYKEKFSGTFQDEKKPEVAHREYISGVLSISKDDIEKGKFNGYLSCYPEIRNYLLEEATIINLRKPYAKLGTVRNEVNHGKKGNEINKIDIEAYNKQFDRIWKEITNLLHAASVKPQLFLNLSNHPSNDWSEEQVKAAQVYGEIEDMEFPKVCPKASEEEIEQLVDDYADRILDLSEEKDVTVHVMGEMTFTMGLVSRLTEQGIRCVASTTTRDTIDKGNGVKESQFQFVRFREYGI